MYNINLKHYRKVFAQFVRLNFAEFVAYRGNFFILLFTLVIETIVEILFFKYIYGNVNAIGGWSFWEVILLLGISGMTYDFMFSFFMQSLFKFRHDVRRGTFDFTLTKPINKIFSISLQQFSPLQVTWFRGSLIIIALYKLQYLPSLEQILGAVILFVSGLIIVYCLYLLISITTLFTITSDGLESIFWQTLFFARYPPSIYPRILSLIFTFITPIILITAVPAQALLGTLTWQGIVTSFSVATVFVIITLYYWRWGLKHYSSASS